MNTRTFLRSLVVALVAPWKAICSIPKPVVTQVLPTSNDNIVGLWVMVDGIVYHIDREWDEWNDRWHGTELMNPRRNKFWLSTPSGRIDLGVLDRHSYKVGPKDWDREWQWDRALTFYNHNPL